MKKMNMSMEINMTPEEKFNQKMWWLLQQIKEADLLRSPEEPFEFFKISSGRVYPPELSTVDYYTAF